MKLRNKSAKLKVIITILIISLTCVSGLIYKLIIDEQINKKGVILSADIKSKVLVELIQLNSRYNNAIIENTVFSPELVEDRGNVVKLMELINNSSNSIATSKKVNTKIKVFNTRLKYLNELISRLKTENPELKNQRDSLFFVLQEFEKQNKFIKSNSLDSNIEESNIDVKNIKKNNTNSIEKPRINKEINNAKAKILEKLYKINITNLTAQTYFIDDNNIKICNTSLKVNQLIINFIIPKNYLIKAGNRDFYIQIYNEQNSLTLDNKTISFGLEQTINYSYKTIIYYDNNLLKVTSKYKLNKLEKGKYFINIYNNEDFVKQSSFTLD